MNRNMIPRLEKFTGLFHHIYSCGISPPLVSCCHVLLHGYPLRTLTLQALYWRTAPLFADVDIDPSSKVCMRAPAFSTLFFVYVFYVRHSISLGVIALATLAIGMARR